MAPRSSMKSAIKVSQSQNADFWHRCRKTCATDGPCGLASAPSAAASFAPAGTRRSSSSTIQRNVHASCAAWLPGPRSACARTTAWLTRSSIEATRLSICRGTYKSVGGAGWAVHIAARSRCTGRATGPRAAPTRPGTWSSAGRAGGAGAAGPWHTSRSPARARAVMQARHAYRPQTRHTRAVRPTPRAAWHTLHSAAVPRRVRLTLLHLGAWAWLRASPLFPRHYRAPCPGTAPPCAAGPPFLPSSHTAGRPTRSAAAGLGAAPGSAHWDVANSVGEYTFGGGVSSSPPAGEGASSSVPPGVQHDARSVA